LPTAIYLKVLTARVGLVMIGSELTRLCEEFVRIFLLLSRDEIQKKNEIEMAVW
jgi:hypothetical protein